MAKTDDGVILRFPEGDMRMGVNITNHGEVENGHVEVKLSSGTLLGWWTVADGKGDGYSRVEVGTTGLSRQEAEAKLDLALEEYWYGG